jgi:predicted nucleic-acid-binding protein
MKVASLDTNAILRWLVGDIPSQQRTVDELLQRDTMYHVADAAVIEATFVMEKVMFFPRELVAEHLQVLMAQSSLAINRALFSKVITLYPKYTSESFMDCCLAVYAQLDDVTPLLTFDKNLAKHLPAAQLIC